MAGNTKNLKPFKPGQSGNPNGRPRILEPIIQKAIDANRNAVKAIILGRLEGQVQDWVDAIIKEGIDHGDPLRFKMLLEIAMGKMIEDQPDFPLSEEEKLLVLEFRRRKQESHNQSVVTRGAETTGSDPDRSEV